MQELMVMLQGYVPIPSDLRLCAQETSTREYTGMNLLANDISRLSSATYQALQIPARNFIDGEFVVTANLQPVTDPSSGQVITQFYCAGAAEAKAAADAAAQAFKAPAWADMGAPQRAMLLHKLAQHIEAETDVLAELETLDVGMPIWMSRHLDVSGAVAALRHMAGYTARAEGRTVPVAAPIPDARFFAATLKKPLGVVAAIIPWNVPLMMAIWKIAPALAAGCTVVLKASREATLSVLTLGRLIKEAGFPPGVVNIIAGGSEAGEALIAHPAVAKVSFTGSTEVGRKVAALAAMGPKKLTLELGGKSPQLVFADADLARCTAGIANSIFLNAGQVCVAGSRLYVHASRHDELVDRLIAHMHGLVQGPGLDENSAIGPLISRHQQQSVQAYLHNAASAGADICTPRPVPDGVDGYYVAPSLILKARQDMQAVREEIFGPVLSISTFHEFEEAIDLANESEYGLSACLWTESLRTALDAAPRLHTGKVAINSEPMPYPALPEGGCKASGYGRELGPDAVDDCLETQSLLIRLH